jgi:hypothetical protein
LGGQCRAKRNESRQYVQDGDDKVALDSHIFMRSVVVRRGDHEFAGQSESVVGTRDDAESEERGGVTYPSGIRLDGQLDAADNSQSRPLRSISSSLLGISTGIRIRFLSISTWSAILFPSRQRRRRLLILRLRRRLILPLIGISGWYGTTLRWRCDHAGRSGRPAGGA